MAQEWHFLNQKPPQTGPGQDIFGKKHRELSKTVSTKWRFCRKILCFNEFFDEKYLVVGPNDYKTPDNHPTTGISTRMSLLVQKIDHSAVMVLIAHDLIIDQGPPRWIWLLVLFWMVKAISYICCQLFLTLPLRCNKDYEKETIHNRHPVHAGAETPANAGIFFVPEELHRWSPLFFS